MKRLWRPLFFIAVDCLGVPVLFHWTVLLVFLAILSYCLLQGWHGSPITVALCTFMAWLLPVCLHEGGHALASRLARTRVLAITLTGLGGRCQTEWPSSIAAWLFVLSGGFIAQGLLGALLYGVQSWSPPADPALRFFITACSIINLILLFSNALPFAGSDGAQILRALREAWRQRSLSASPESVRSRR